MIRPTQFTALAAVTLVTMTAAAILHATSTRWNVGQVEGSSVLPGLMRQMSQIGAIEMRRGEEVMTLLRQGDAWRLKERGGYPVLGEKVRALLVQLTEARLIEPKTALKERHALLELEDPTVKGAKSNLVRILDTQSKVLSEVIIGKSRHDVFGAGRSGFYVRLPRSDQTWLASGSPAISLETRDWVDRQVLKLTPADIKRITIETAGSAPLVIEKGEGADPKFALAKVPEGKKLKQNAGVEGIPLALASIELEDVRKLAAPPTGEGVTTIRIEQPNGAVLTLLLSREGADDKKTAWLSITATGAGEAKKSVDEINARTRGWDFKIPSWKADQIGKTEADLLEAAS